MDRVRLLPPPSPPLISHPRSRLLFLAFLSPPSPRPQRARTEARDSVGRDQSSENILFPLPPPPPLLAPACQPKSKAVMEEGVEEEEGDRSNAPVPPSVRHESC